MDSRDVIYRYRGSLGVWLGAVVVLGLVFGPDVVDDVNGDLDLEVQAGADASALPGDPGTVTVRWTSNQNADTLSAWVEGPSDVAGPTNATRVVLDQVGETAVFEETGATGGNQSLVVYVEAVNDHSERRILVKWEVTL